MVPTAANTPHSLQRSRYLSHLAVPFLNARAQIQTHECSTERRKLVCCRVPGMAHRGMACTRQPASLAAAARAAPHPPRCAFTSPSSATSTLTSTSGASSCGTSSSSGACCHPYLSLLEQRSSSRQTARAAATFISVTYNVPSCGYAAADSHPCSTCPVAPAQSLQAPPMLHAEMLTAVHNPAPHVATSRTQHTS